MKKFAALLIAVLLLVSALPVFAYGGEAPAEGNPPKKDEKSPTEVSTGRVLRVILYKRGSGIAVGFPFHVTKDDKFTVKLNDEEFSGYTFENDFFTLSPEVMETLDPHSYYLLICSSDGNYGFVLDIIPEVVHKTKKSSAPSPW